MSILFRYAMEAWSSHAIFVSGCVYLCYIWLNKLTTISPKICIIIHHAYSESRPKLSKSLNIHREYISDHI